MRCSGTWWVLDRVSAHSSRLAEEQRAEFVCCNLCFYGAVAFLHICNCSLLRVQVRNFHPDVDRTPKGFYRNLSLISGSEAEAQALNMK